MIAPALRREISALICLASALIASVAFLEGLCIVCGIFSRISLLFAVTLAVFSPFVCGMGVVLGIISGALYKKATQKVDLVSLQLSIAAVCVLASEALLLLLIHKIAPEVLGFSLG